MSAVDRSALAVAGFVAALPAALYDVRLVPSVGGGAVESRRLDRDGIMAALPWLRARNSAGYHVYARPMAASHIMVDDLSPDGVRSLLRVHRPAALVETSPGSYQAWLTITDKQVQRERAAALARLLARRLGGDPGAANPVQLGRLPGTTNRKPERQRPDGSFPYALLRRAAPGADPAAEDLLASLPPEERSYAVETVTQVRTTATDLTEATRSQAELRRFLGDARMDRSRADFALARRALSRGVPLQRVVSLVLASERSQEMPSASALNYAARTVAAAARALRLRRECRSSSDQSCVGAPIRI